MVNLVDYEAWKAKRQQESVGVANVVLSAAEDTPDAVAGDLNLSTQFAKTTGGAPPPLPMVKEYRNVFQQRIDEAKNTTILAQSPRLTEWLRNPENASVARDDLEGLSWWETTAGATKNAMARFGNSIPQSYNQFLAADAAERAADQKRSFGEIYSDARSQPLFDFGPLGNSRLIDTAVGPITDAVSAGTRYLTSRISGVIGGDQEKAAAEYQRLAGEAAKRIEAIPMSPAGEAAKKDIAALKNLEGDDWNKARGLLHAIAKNPKNFAAFAAETMVESLPTLAAAAAVGVATRSPTAAATTMGLGSAGREFGSGAVDYFNEQKVDISTPEGAMAAVSNPDLMREALKRGGARAAIIGILDGLSGGVAGQALAKTPATDMALRAVLQAAMGAGGEAAGQVGSGQKFDIVDVMIEGLVEFTTAPVEVAALGGSTFMNNRAKAADAAERKFLFAELSAKAQISALRNRMPDKFRQFVEEATADGAIENVYVPALEFIQYFQSVGIDPYVLIETELDGVTRDELDAALAGGGDLKIPTATYAAKIAGSDHDAFLMENMRFDPDQMTAKEAAAFNEKAEDALQEAWQVAEDMRREQEKFRSFEAEIYDTMVSRLRVAGRSTDVATSEAMLYPAFYRVMAERANMAVDEFMARYPLPQVEGARPQGMQLRDVDALTRTLAEARSRKAVRDKRQTLLEFISDYGGINDVGGELRSMDAETVSRGPGKKMLRLARKGVLAGMSDMLGASGKRYGQDDIARTVIEAGYLADDPIANAYRAATDQGTEAPDVTPALWAAIERELRGEAQYSAQDDVDPAVAASADIDQIEAYLSRLGVSLDDDDAKIRAALAEGEGKQYGQVSPDQARAIDMAVEMPSDPLFAEAVANTKGAEITADGLLIDLVRYQKEEQTGATSVRTGVFYLPAGSKDARHYKKGAQGGPYGGAVVSRGETILKRPLFVKGATGGKAPEAAFDALKGKGAGAKLSDDAMGVLAVKPSAWGNRDPSKFYAAVEKFLADYGADASMADEIIENSKQGNQLRYALQENVVAHAVREAGYDSVVGYSKGKAGASISEVFDVREIDYPTPGETASLHPQFEPVRGRQYGQTPLLFQNMAGTPRGSVQFPSAGVGNGDTVIRLFESADLSTVLHESGHYFLTVMQDMAARGEPNAATDYASVKDWWRAEAAGVAKDAMRVMPDVTVTEADVLAALDTGTTGDTMKDAAIDVGMQEQWARAFETYLMEGKAPSVELRGAFEKFRAWLLSVYRRLAGLNVNPNDDLRAVFDRMLASDEEIVKAQNEAGGNANLFATAEQMGLTPEEFDRFTKLRSQAEDDAKAKLLRETMAPIRRERDKWYRDEKAKVREEVERDLKSAPIYRAVQEMRFGKTFDGDETPSMKMSRDAIEREFGAGYIGFLPGATKDGKGHRTAVFTNEGGIHPDVAAGTYGFPSGGALLDALTKTPPIGEAITAEVERVMMERHGDVLNDGAIEAEALDAVHGDKRGQWIAAELKAITEIADRDVGMTFKEARATAKQTASRMRVRDAMNASRFLSAERKAAEEAGRLGAMLARDSIWMGNARRRVAGKARAAMRGDGTVDAVATQADQANRSTGNYNETVERLIDAKRRQLLNHALYMEARTVADRIEKTTTKLSKLNRTNAKQAKTRNLDHVMAARAIASRFGLATADTAFDFDAWVEQLKIDDPAVAAAMMQAIATYANNPTTFKDLTVSEFGAVNDAIESILETGKRYKLLEIEGRTVDRQAAIDELVQVLETRGLKSNKALQRALTDGEKNGRSARSMLSALRRMENWAREMDDGKQGVFTRYLVRPIMNATDAYRAEKATLLGELLAIINPRREDMLGGTIEAPELGYTFKNRGELLHAILHTGNASNKEKLLLGRGWSDGLTGQTQAMTRLGQARVDRQGTPIMTRGEVDTSKWDAFVARMIAEEKITKADFDTAQAIWDLNEKMKRPAQTAHRQMFGYYFDEIEAAPIVTPFGTYRGGYVPAIADTDASNDGQMRADQAAMEQQQTSFMFPTTGKGFTKARVQNYHTPLALNFMLLPAHMDKVLRFTHLEPTVRQTAAIVTNRGMREALDGFDSSIAPDLITPWLQRTAQQAVETQPSTPAGRAFSSLMREFRKRVGVHTMFANLVNTAQQITGFSSAAILVKPGAMKKSLVAFSTGEAAAMRGEASAKSPFMRDRVEMVGRETQRRIQDVVDEPTIAGSIRGFVDKHGYFMQSATQGVVDVIVWHAAYDQSIGKGMSEADAIFEADSVIRRTMGDFSPENVSLFETGSAFQRLFTMFASYFNGQANLIGGEMQTTMRTMGWNGSGRVFMIYLFGIAIPAIVGEMIAASARGDLEDEDEDGYADEIAELFFGSQAKYMTGMIPVVGQITNSLIARFNSKPYDDGISMTPVVSTVEKAISAPVSIGSAVFGEGSARKAVVDGLVALGLVTGIPTNWLAKPAGYVASVAEGRSKPEGAIDITQGIISGRDGSER